MAKRTRNRKKNNRQYDQQREERLNGYSRPKEKDKRSIHKRFTDTENLIEQIITYYQQGRISRAEKSLGYLRENQADTLHLYCKSLSVLSQKIPIPSVQFALLAEAAEINPYDTVTLSSYGTALAQAERYEEAFKQFEHSLRIDAENTVTRNSYGTTLAQAERYEEAFKQFEHSLRID
ncbi:MAG: tetratricopeptide repeat protein, partial [Chloroflexota bacterium]